MAPATQSKKPALSSPRSLFQYPEDLILKMGKRPPVASGTYIVKNDVTDQIEEHKVTRISTARKDDE